MNHLSDNVRLIRVVLKTRDVASDVGLRPLGGASLKIDLAAPR